MSPAFPESYTLKPCGAERSWPHRSRATAPTLKEKVSQHQHSSLHADSQVWDRRVQCVSQHWSLVRRATLIQRRVRTLLREHTIQLFIRQLNTLRGQCLGDDVLLASPSPLLLSQEPTFLGIAQVSLTHALQAQDASRDVQHLASCVKMVMREAQLDSDATESSSDEEPDHEVTPGPQRVPVGPEPIQEATGARQGTSQDGAPTRNGSLFGHGGQEWRWQAERAEIGSRWVWLQVRVAELGAKIQSLNNLHRRIISSKGWAVLAGPRPPAGDLVHQECPLQTGPSPAHPCHSHDSASDSEAEPSSPMRLLRNIERQSAQLALIVSRLRVPLCSAPLTEPEPTLLSRWTDNNRLVHLKKHQSCCRNPRSSESARTRPLLTYQKHQLFTFDPQRPGIQQEPSLACLLCDSCHPRAVSTEKYCSREAPMGVDGRRWAKLLRPHPVLSLSSAFSSTLMCQRTYREESPFTHRGQRKRRHLSRSSEDVEPSSNQSTSTEDTPEEVTVPQETLTQELSSTQRRNSWGRRGGLPFDINDVIIPISLVTTTKRVEPQQKHIVTPSWRVVEIEPLDGGEEAPVGVEALSDEAFAHRHLPYEAAERLHWASWKCSWGHRQTDSPSA